MVRDPARLLTEVLPKVGLSAMSNLFKGVQCLDRETREGALTVGFGVDTGGPSFSIGCSRLSCYQCLTTAAASLANPLLPLGQKVVAFILDKVRLAATAQVEVVQEQYQAVMDLLDELLDAQEQQEGNVDEDFLEAVNGMSSLG